MHHNTNRTKEVVRRTAVYSLMVLTIISLLIFLTMRMLGYTLDLGTNKLQQTGLIQYNSYPSGAMVSVDGREVRRTQTKNTLLPGVHNFSMKLDGYEQWQKNLKIESNTVTQLNYARLIPEKRTTKKVKTFEDIDMLSLAPAGNFLAAVGKKDQSPIVIFGDLRDTSNEKFVEHALNTAILAGYSLSADNHTFAIDEWSENGRYLLLKHTYLNESGAATVQWLRLDRENPKDLIDITSVAGFVIKRADFIGNDGREIYSLQDGGELRRINLGDSTISSPLLTGVEDYVVYRTDRLAYVAANSNEKVVGVWKKDWKTPFVVGRFALDKSPKAIVSHYFHEDTVAFAVDKKLTFYRGELSDSSDRQREFLKAAKTINLDLSAEELSVNDSGRILMVRGGELGQSYDLERAELSSQIKLFSNRKVSWLDDFHIWSVNGSGKVIIQEFDGMNSHEMLEADGDLGAVLSQNQKQIYSLKKNSSGAVVLNKMNMTTGTEGWF